MVNYTFDCPECGKHAYVCSYSETKYHTAVSCHCGNCGYSDDYLVGKEESDDDGSRTVE